MFNSTPLEGKKSLNCCWREEEKSDQVKLSNKSTESQLGSAGNFAVGNLDTKKKERDEAADGKIDVEALI